MTDEIKSERITILLSPSELKELDDWSFDRRIRSRGEAIRQLLALGLEASGEHPKEQPSAKSGQREAGRPSAKKAEGRKTKGHQEETDLGLEDQGKATAPEKPRKRPAK
jgi:metal-responsive CopG/Arc/MetJ family transcriptional regulator